MQPESCGSRRRVLLDLGRPALRRAKIAPPPKGGKRKPRAAAGLQATRGLLPAANPARSPGGRPEPAAPAIGTPVAPATTPRAAMPTGSAPPGNLRNHRRLIEWDRSNRKRLGVKRRQHHQNARGRGDCKFFNHEGLPSLLPMFNENIIRRHRQAEMETSIFGRKEISALVPVHSPTGSVALVSSLFAA